MEQAKDKIELKMMKDCNHKEKMYLLELQIGVNIKQAEDQLTTLSDM